MDIQKYPAVSREEIARIEIGRTEISPSLAKVAVFFFLFFILIVPVGQYTHEAMEYLAGARITPFPEALSIIGHARNAGRLWRTSELDLYRRIFDVNRSLLKSIKEYENRLEEVSWLQRWVLPPTQYVLSSVLGVGNEKAYIGIGGWLFYGPGVSHVTGAGFLSPRHMVRRSKSGDGLSAPIHPDPIRTILQFRDELKGRNIELVVMPVPDKITIHPESFVKALDSGRMLQNRSYRTFLSALESHRVRVFDASAALAEFRKKRADAAFFMTDTHWTPPAMEYVAAELAGYVRPLLSPAPREPLFLRQETAVTNLGDIAVMLKLPLIAPWPTRETATIHPIVRNGRNEAPSDNEAEILLLGDSFSNIFSAESMGWGTASGLSAQLAFALNRPVDALVRNDEGAWSSRQMLAAELSNGRNRLASKKVVIWEFAARELSYGDWKPIELIQRETPSNRAQVFNAENVRGLTGARTRLAWAQPVYSANKDIHGVESLSRLMGFDSDDGRGVRTILPGPLSCRKPIITPDGERIVFTDYPQRKIWVVNWDGTGLRNLVSGYALDVRADPVSGRIWVYAITGQLNSPTASGRPVVRFDLDRTETQETVWQNTDVTLDNFQVSADGLRAGGLFPWPYAGIAELDKGKWTSIGTGCWTSFAPDNSYVAWYFDGAHRNLILKDHGSGETWKVAIDQGPGVGGYEVYHPRWSNHPRFFTMTGPYKAGKGEIRVGNAGRNVEIYLGRFSPDLRYVDGWTKITENNLPDFFPDAWVDPKETTFTPVLAKTGKSGRHSGGVTKLGKLVVEAELLETSRTPAPKSIAPYRQALVVHSYRILKVIEGTPPGQRILVAHWAIRDGKATPPIAREGDILKLFIEPYEAHRELEGERLIMEVRDTGLPLFYQIPGSRSVK